MQSLGLAVVAFEFFDFRQSNFHFLISKELQTWKQQLYFIRGMLRRRLPKISQRQIERPPAFLISPLWSSAGDRLQRTERTS